MLQPTPAGHIVALERQVLRRLCATHCRGPAAEDALRKLRSYRWHDSDHRVIAETLAGLSATSRPWTRDELAAEATRLGFPDISWPEYFQPDAAANDARATNHSLADLLRELLALRDEKS